MNVDNELELWRSEWTAEPAPDIPDLPRRVKRQSRFMQCMVAIETLITIVIGGGVTAMAAREPRPDLITLAAATWLFIAAAWGFAIWNRRGAWKPASLSTTAYLDILIRRCRRAVRAAAFGMILFTVEMLFCLGWIYNRLGSPDFLFSPAMIAIEGGTFAFFVCSALYRSRKKSELVRWIELQAQVQDSTGQQGDKAPQNPAE